MRGLGEGASLWHLELGGSGEGEPWQTESGVRETVAWASGPAGVGLIFQSYCAFYGIGQPSPRGRSFSFTVVIVTSWPPLQETRGCTGARRGVRWLVVVLLPDWAPFPSGPAFERFLPPIPGL